MIFYLPALDSSNNKNDKFKNFSQILCNFGKKKPKNLMT